MNALAQPQVISDGARRAQQTFRTVLDAMSFPGRITEIGHNPAGPGILNPATIALARCLFDHETRIWMGDGVAGVDVYDFLKFHCGCPVTKSSLEAHFAIVSTESGVPGLTQFNAGSDVYPDRATTLIVQVPDLEDGPPISLTGPGIETEATLRISGVPDYLWRARQEQQALFPCGVDLVFTSGSRSVALPRSTEIGL